MALIFDSDAYSRKSRRHAASGRRRATTSYDKYGYQVATFDPSSFSSSSDVMHVLRVKPGVVVNFIDAPSSRSRTRQTSHAVEYRPSRKSSHAHTRDDGRDSWKTTYSPHPRVLDLPMFDDHVSSQPFVAEAPVSSRDYPPSLRHSPPSHHSTPDMHYRVEPHNSPRHSSAPIDIPVHPHSSDFSAPSISTHSSDSEAPDYGRAVEPSYYFAPRHPPVPIEIPMPMSSSGRPRSRSFDFAPRSGYSSSSQPSHTRTVRFNEDPVLPSPEPVFRRKGWWNKKGDQLWDNDGAYAPAPAHDTYPPDLRDYPESGTGWMNEDGVHIDTKRRIVRKKPLRSALKKTSSV